MKIFETSVRKPISTILIFIGVIIFGLYSMRNLAIDLYPDMDIPVISVVTQYYGVSASDIENNVTKILENNLNIVDNLDKITSKSMDNISVISLEFEWGSDITEAANDVRDAISKSQTFLPEGIEAPLLMKFSSSSIPVVILSATADKSYPALEKILDDKFVNRINRIGGVGSVSLSGTPVREVHVYVDPSKIEAYNLSVEQIGSIIQAENINISGGSIDIGTSTFTVKTEGEFFSSDEIKDIVIANKGGKQILLSDVARVEDTLRELTIDQRTMGEQSIVMMVLKQSGANTVEIAKEILEAIPEIQKTLPDDVKIELLYDTSDNIKDSISSLSETIMYAFIFVILVVLFFLGRWRATFIIILTIPVSLITAFIYLYTTGDSINIISLSSLSIAIGMVVDDAIVVLENITKHMERGSSPRESSIYGTNEVWLAVIATTLTVLAVFLPLTMLSGMAGIMFKSLGWIVSIVTMVSTVAAVTLIPMLTSQLLKFNKKGEYKGMMILFKPIDKFLDKMDNGYGSMLEWSLRHKSFMISGSVAIFAASLLLLQKVPTEFFPQQDNALISAVVKLQQSLSVEETTKTARKIDSLLENKYPEIRIFSTSAGSDANDAQSQMKGNTGSYIMNLIMNLEPKAERELDIFQIADQIREDLKQFPEIIESTVTAGSTGTGGGGPGAGSFIQVKVFGQDFNEADMYARELRDKLKTVKGTRDVKLSRDDLRIEYVVKFDRKRLAYYGLNTSTVGSYVRNRIQGLTPTKFREDGEEYDIVVRYEKEFRRSIEDIENILIYTPDGKSIRLKDVGHVEQEETPPTIEREDRQRVVSVMASIHGEALGTVAEDVKKIVADTYVPDGLFVEVGGTIEDQDESFADIGMLLILIVIMVYIVMATQFESFSMPFIIMFSLPFAFSGVFIALYLSNTPLSLIALIGSIMLVGIVVKNGIVIVDYMNLLRERGLSISNSVIMAGRSRLRPVLMTTLTTILGMMPLAFGAGQGSEAWQPMGIAVIGGLTFSTILTLVVIPIAYALFSYSELRKEMKALRKARKEEKNR